ncbi:pentapeptide repeat-containing protein [Spirillospora sp. CA-255316]
MGTRGTQEKAARLREPAAPKLPPTLARATYPEDEPADDSVHLSLHYGSFDLVGLDVESVEFERCRFDETRLAGTTFRRAGLADVAFKGCDLANLRMFDSRMFGVAIEDCRLTGLSLTDCGFRDVLFRDCRADLTSFRFSRFKNVVFRGCNLAEANFQGADLRGARFEDCKLTGAQFSAAQMQGTRLANCDLYGVNGIQSFEGAIVNTTDAQGLLYALTAAMGITIED